MIPCMDSGAAGGIRRATDGDVEVVLGFDHVARGDPRRREFVRGAVAAGQCYVRTDDDGRAVAYAVLEYTFFDHGFVSMLYVAEAHRRRGFGAELMRHAERECRTPRLFTSTNRSNGPMRALLAALGYRPSGVIENLEETGDDAELVFFKPLSP